MPMVLAVCLVPLGKGGPRDDKLNGFGWVSIFNLNVVKLVIVVQFEIPNSSSIHRVGK
jgi:hypothetical protein